MRAWIKSRTQSGTLVEEADILPGALTPDHIEIAVKATSLNPVDNKLLHKTEASNDDIIIIPHGDVSGIVSRVGRNVREFREGDHVYGCAGGIGGLSGALADFMIADKRLIAPMPSSLDFKSAAALPLASITAWEGLIDKARIGRNDRVLIHGGAGGVGHLALQLAKIYGGAVAATVSSEAKADIARRLGADETINYKSETIDQYVGRLTSHYGFDIVFDTVGGDVLASSIAAARNNGCVITINNPLADGVAQAYRKGLSVHFVMMLLPLLTGDGRERHGRTLRKITALVDEGRLGPLVDKKTFSFSQANEAHAYFESGAALGKIILLND